MKSLYEKSKPELIKEIESLQKQVDKLGKSVNVNEKSEKRLAEIKLQESEELLNATQHISKVGGWQWNVQNQTMLWTEETYRIHEINPNEIELGPTEHIERGLNCYDEKNRPVILEAFRKCASEGKSYDMQFPFTTVKGKKLWICTTAKAIQENGKVVRVVSNIMDITEQRLAEEKILRFSCIFKDSLNEIYLFETDSLKFIQVNTAAQQNLSYTLEELQNMTPIDIKPDITTEAFEKIVAPLRKGEKKMIVFETVHQRKDQSLYNVEVHLQLLKFDNEALFAAIILDITERKKAEDELYKSEERFKQVAEATGDWIWEVDKKGLYTYASKVSENLLGYLPDEIVGKKHFYDFFKPEIKKNFKKAALEVFSKKESIENFENPNIHKDGRIVILETSGVPILDAKGNLLGYRGADKDITECKNAEDVLKSSEAEFRALINAISQPAFLLDRDYRIIIANKALAENMGKTVEELRGYRGLESLPPDVAQRRKKYITKVFETGHPVNFEDESSKNCYLHFIYPVLDSQDNVSEVAIFSLKITEQKKAENELKESEEKFRIISEQSFLGIAIIQNGKFVFVNEQFSNMSEYSMEEMRNWAPGEFSKTIHPDDMTFVLEQATKKQIGEKNVVDQDSYRIYTKSGKLKWHEIFSKTIIYKGESANLAAVIDITERKENELALWESEEKFRSLFDDAINMIYILNTDGYIIDVNRSQLEKLGYTKEELIGKHILEIVAPERVENDKIIMNNILEEKKSAEVINIFETILSTKTGEKIYVELNATPQYYDGKIIAYRGIMTDITERKAAMNALSNSERKYRIVSDYTIDMEYWLNENREYVYISPACINITGISREELFADPELFFNIIHPDDKEFVINHYSYEFDVNHNCKFDFRIIPKDGKEKWISHFCRPVYDESGKWIGRRANNSDITQRKLAEKELNDYRMHLEELVKKRTESLENEIKKRKKAEKEVWYALEKEKEMNELKTRFISTVSHELRTPLTAIKSSSELLQRYGSKWDDEKKNEQFNRINGSIGYLIDLMEDVLTMSRTDSGKIVFAPETVNMKDLIESIIYKVSVVDDNAHILDFNFKGKKQETETDPRLLSITVNNLLNNAIKYSPFESRIEIIVHLNKYINIEIIDQGIGIPVEGIDLLFEPFYRAGNVNKYKGSGLGLSIVKKSIELLNGSITVESEINKGSKFLVKIPINKK